MLSVDVASESRGLSHDPVFSNLYEATPERVPCANYNSMQQETTRFINQKNNATAIVSKGDECELARIRLIKFGQVLPKAGGTSFLTIWPQSPLRLETVN